MIYLLALFKTASIEEANLYLANSHGVKFTESSLNPYDFLNPLKSSAFYPFLFFLILLLIRRDKRSATYDNRLWALIPSLFITLCPFLTTTQEITTTWPLVLIYLLLLPLMLNEVSESHHALEGNFYLPSLSSLPCGIISFMPSSTISTVVTLIDHKCPLLRDLWQRNVRN